jgi:hypothetical protein
MRVHAALAHGSGDAHPSPATGSSTASTTDHGGVCEPGASQPQLSRRGVLLGSALPAAATLWLPRSARAAAPATTSTGSFEDRVSEFTLPSGLHFILLRRPEVRTRESGVRVVVAHVIMDLGWCVLDDECSHSLCAFSIPLPLHLSSHRLPS